LAERGDGHGSLYVEVHVSPVYLVIAVQPSLRALAVVLAVIRADPKDLPAIVRALIKPGSRDDKRDGDDGNDPPSLPKP
jgi:hypothetical protein